MSFLLLCVDNDVQASHFSGQTKQMENNSGLGRMENILVNPKEKSLFLFLFMHHLENQLLNGNVNSQLQFRPNFAATTCIVLFCIVFGYPENISY